MVYRKPVIKKGAIITAATLIGMITLYTIYSRIKAERASQISLKEWRGKTRDELKAAIENLIIESSFVVEGKEKEECLIELKNLKRAYDHFNSYLVKS